jgi:predicted DNA-binding transcriptional regulator YafY
MNEKINNSALRRIVEIDKMLQKDIKPSMKDFTEKFEVCARTVRRDFDVMKDVFGAELEYSRKGNYWSYKDPEFKLFPATMSEDELFAILIGSRILEEYKGTPYEDSLKMAFHRITTYFDEEVTLQLMDKSDIMSFYIGRGSKINESIFDNISKAILQRKECEIIYNSFARNEVSKRTIQPYHLINILGDWYVISYCKLREAFRTFALSRIMNLNVFQREFVRDDKFNIEEYLSDTLVLEKCGETVDVAIEFDEYQARWIKEKEWHPTQEILEREDGSILFRISVSSLDEVKRWILSFGEHAKVITPPELVSSIKDSLEMMRGKYK